MLTQTTVRWTGLQRYQEREPTPAETGIRSQA